MNEEAFARTMMAGCRPASVGDLCGFIFYLAEFDRRRRSKSGAGPARVKKRDGVSARRQCRGGASTYSRASAAH